MVIHVVQPGETAYGIAQAYGVPVSLLVRDNGLTQPDRLAVGQALVVRFPQLLHTVQQGETLFSISRRYGVPLRLLFQYNPGLGGSDRLYPGQLLVLAYRDATAGPPVAVNGYAYPAISPALLRSILPGLSALTPFTYGFTTAGRLIPPADSSMRAMAARWGTPVLLHLSTLTEEGGFSSDLAHLALTDPVLQETLLEQVVSTVADKGYAGVDVDFEYLPGEDSAAYAAFLTRLRARLAPFGLPVIAALAPKTSSSQPGLLYEGHDYAAIGAAADQVLLMTYEWGYTYGPPMAVAPLPNVRQVVEYALAQLPAEKAWLGLPFYGYDWPLPFVAGQSKARSLSSQQAVELAVRYGAEIQYSQRDQAPWFRYTDAAGTIHEVWFEDPRSALAKLSLVPEYGLLGVGIWNLDRPFPPFWPLFASRFSLRPF